jgi:hypothetical protein
MGAEKYQQAEDENKHQRLPSLFKRTTGTR